MLAAYRERLVTVGLQVRADRIGADPVVGTAVDLTATGALVVQTASGARVEVLAADVHHLRPVEGHGSWPVSATPWAAVLWWLSGW